MGVVLSLDEEPRGGAISSCAERTGDAARPMGLGPIFGPHEVHERSDIYLYVPMH